MVELALAEIGAECELRDVDLDRNEQREPAFAALNPQCKLPLLVTPDGQTLTETAAILLTLDECHPGARLMPPQATAERAFALRWMMFVATEIYPIVEINDYPERFSTERPGAAAETREIARSIWRSRWKLLEDNVPCDPFVLGEQFSLTDIYIAVVSRWAQQDRWRPDHLPKVERLTAAVASRPACARPWARHFAPRESG